MRTIFVLLAVTAAIGFAPMAHAQVQRQNQSHYGYRYAKKYKVPAHKKVTQAPIVNPDDAWNPFDPFKGLIKTAEKHVGKNAAQLGLPRSLWCADFLNWLTGSGKDRTARSYLKRGTPAQSGCIGCVAVLSRNGGGHVGIVKKWDKAGNPVLISGNSWGGKVTELPYPKSRVLGYRWVPPKEMPPLNPPT